MLNCEEIFEVCHFIVTARQSINRLYCTNRKWRKSTANHAGWPFPTWFSVMGFSHILMPIVPPSGNKKWGLWTNLFNTSLHQNVNISMILNWEVNVTSGTALPWWGNQFTCRLTQTGSVILTYSAQCTVDLPHYIHFQTGTVSLVQTGNAMLVGCYMVLWGNFHSAVAPRLTQGGLIFKLRFLVWNYLPYH